MCVCSAPEPAWGNVRFALITAMDATTLPAALLRSGRVELWLSTRLPDARACETILRERLGALPRAFPAANAETCLANQRSYGR